jgi:hypothetical protein
MIDQFPFHRIHVHVLEVFDFLFLTSHIEPEFPDYGAPPAPYTPSLPE